MPESKRTPEANATQAHGRVSQLDGLRAIAILMVFAHHSTDLFPIGWAGVHLFFVLSGFLITRILWRAREDEFYWAPFYIKRATRIVPPLVPFFITCAFVVSINWKTEGLAYLFFGANIIQSVHTMPVTELTVLWSLAVEEHFYLLWPFAVRYLQRRSLIVLLAAVMVVEPMARALATRHVSGWSPIYQLTCFQLDGLAAGSLIALLVQDKSCLAWLRRYAGTCAIVSVAVLAASSINPAFNREQNSVVFNLFGYTLIVLTCAFALAYLFTREHSLVSRALSIRPLIFVGTISYGMYLYTGFIARAMRWGIAPTAHHRGSIGILKLVLELALTIVVSWFSFHFYETLIIRWGRGKANALSVRGGRTMEAVEMASGEV